MDGITVGRVSEHTGSGAFRIAASIDADCVAAIREQVRAVLVFGPDARAAHVAASLALLGDHAARCRSIVLASRDRLADFQELIDADRIFYLAAGELAESDLDALIAGALDAIPAPDSLDHFLTAGALRRMALAQSVAELADALRDAILKTANADRARCVLFDDEREVLWVPHESEGESAAAGLVGFILRTGISVSVPRAGDDARFDAGLDDPGGSAADRFLGVPVHAGGAVLAVLVAVRGPNAAPFEPFDAAALEALAAHASPYLATWLTDPATPYRAEALRAREQPAGAFPEPLRLEPAWARRATWFVLASFAVLVAALVLGKGWLP